MKPFLPKTLLSYATRVWFLDGPIVSTIDEVESESSWKDIESVLNDSTQRRP
jgi:hypothetical protein